MTSSRRRRPSPLVLALAACLGGACGAREKDPGYHSASANIVLIVVDALRADALGCYGASRPTSPNIDALAARSIVYERAFSAAPWTLPSLASLFTGTYPALHGQMRAWGERSTLSNDLVTLPEALAEGGYETVASAHPWVSPAHGFAQGIARKDFHEIRDASTPKPDAQLTAAVLEWLRSRPRGGRPFFAYLHYMGPHNPYSPSLEMQRAVLGTVPSPPPFSSALARVPLDDYFDHLTTGALTGWLTPEDARYLRALYDADVRRVDTEVGRVLAALSEHRMDEETVIVVTADHGESFLEHKVMVHGRALHPETLRIPLLIRLPGASPRRIEERVGNVDVMPTVLEAVNLPVPAQVQGNSRLPGRAWAEGAVFAQADFDEREVKIMRGPFVYVAATRDLKVGRLYDSDADPEEMRDVAVRHPEEVDSLRRELERFLAESGHRRAALGRRAPPSPDASTREALRALGYVK